MKDSRHLRLVSLIVLLALLLAASPERIASADPAPLDQPRLQDYRPGAVLVAFKPGIASTQSSAVLQRYDAARVQSLPGLGVQVLRVPEGEEPAISAALSREVGVLYAEPDYRYRAFTTPNDDHYAKQWGHARINSEMAWEITTGSASVVIAIVDTGVDLNHPDLASKLVPGQSFLNLGQADANPMDTNGHGTHVAGIAAAIGNNGTGIAGMAWGARIMPLRVLEADGSGYTSDIALGVQWAWQNGADIINLSLGGPDYSQTLQDVVNDAHSSGALVVAAMGNCRVATGDNTPCPTANPTAYPAAMDNVMAVSATGPTNTYAYYSQYGDHNDIAAPGGAISYQPADGIYSTMPTYDVDLTLYWGHAKNYDYLQGTSQATPFVAGLAALIRSLQPAMTPDEVQSLIETTAQDLGDKGKDANYGHGLIDAAAAIATIVKPGTPTLSQIDNDGGKSDFWVTWSSVNYATGYRLEEDDNPYFTSPIQRYAGTNTQVLVTGRAPGTWYYRVQAYNSSSNSDWSALQSVTVAPNAPQMQVIENTGEPDAYRISWASAVGATGYRLEEDSTGAFTSPTVRYAGTDTVYNVTGQPNGTWYYRVRAYNQGGNSNWSTQVFTMVATMSVPVPPIHTIDNLDGDHTYTVTWTSIPTATGYILEESASPYFSHPTEVYQGQATSYHVADQSFGTWYYRSRAITPAGKSPWSAAQAAVVPTYIHLPLIARNYQIPASGSVIRNGDFEAGGSDWTETSPQGFPLIVDTDYIKNYSGNTLLPHSGSWLAWLGGVLSETHFVKQDVFIAASEPYLTYWRWIGSEEVDCGADTGAVLIDDVVAEAIQLCDTTETTDWESQSLDLSAYGNQTVTLKFEVTTDVAVNSNLFLDDISFQASPTLQMQATPVTGGDVVQPRHR